MEIFGKLCRRYHEARTRNKAVPSRPGRRDSRAGRQEPPPHALVNSNHRLRSALHACYTNLVISIAYCSVKNVTPSSQHVREARDDSADVLILSDVSHGRKLLPSSEI